LGLPSPNAGLSDAELAAKLQADEADIAREDEAAARGARGGADEDEDEDEEVDDDLADVIAQIQAAELAEREGRPWVQG
jgi:ribosome-binding protein aMBF1 (putative translation factor)